MASQGRKTLSHSKAYKTQSKYPSKQAYNEERRGRDNIQYPVILKIALLDDHLGEGGRPQKIKPLLLTHLGLLRICKEG